MFENGSRMLTPGVGMNMATIAMDECNDVEVGWSRKLQ